MNRSLLMFACSLAAIACGPPKSPATTESESETGHTESSGEPEPTETETNPETETGTDFVPNFDDANGDDCDPWQQDCPEGEKCVPWSSNGGGGWDANKCVPIFGTQEPGEPCEYAGPTEATDDCDGASMCWNVDEDGLGTCTAFCLGSPDVPECPPSSQCLVSGSGVISLCIEYCDPVVQDCGDGQGCYWFGDSFACAHSVADIPVGQPCGFINDCAPGLTCVPGGMLPECADVNCCTPFCDVGLVGAGCVDLPGTTCIPFFEEGLPDNPYIGVCLLPD